MVTGGHALEGRRSRLDAAREALDALGEVLHEASGPGLAELLEEVDDVAAAAGAARVAVVREAVRRGEVAPGEAPGWVREHARSLRQGGAGHVAEVAVRVATDGAGLAVNDVQPDPRGTVGQVWSAVEAGRLSASTAVAVWREADRLAPLLQPAAAPTVTEALVDLAERWGPGMMRRLRPRLLAEHGHQGALDDLDQRLSAAARLSSPHVESGDLTEYQLAMTPEQAAALEAAIGPLSAPAPNPDTGEWDTRPAGRRRVEALAEVCRQSSGLAAEAAGPDGAAVSSAVLHVSVELSDLEARTGAGEVVGSTADGVLLAPETLRRVACDAALVPYVLGTAGEVLDVGRVARLFTRAQRRLLWRRDRGCSYPGCAAPATWARAHHVRHWADGGTSDVANAALLCQRHHTTVHRRRLWAEVRDVPDERDRYVVWDLTDGSYDRALQRAQGERAGPDRKWLRTRLLDAADRAGPRAGPPADLDEWWDAVAADEQPWASVPARC